MIDIPKQIRNVELLTDIFGRFPSFHDSEIVRLALERGSRNESGPILTAEVHVFEMTKEVDSQNKFILKNHTLAALRFAGVRDLVIDDFNQQNVVGGLSIESSPNGHEFSVAFESLYGADLRFRCGSISVESVQPFLKNGNS